MNNKETELKRKLDPTKKESYKKYNIVVIFPATRCSLKLSKEEEKKLRKIKKEIISLYAEQQVLLK